MFPLPFESLVLHCFMINGVNPLLGVLIHRPPKFNMVFIYFITVLISGDFNIHVCCLPGFSFTVGVMVIVHSFILAQSVDGPTHLKGNTLDIIVSSSFIFDSDYVMLCVFDYKASISLALLLSPAPTVTTYVSFHVLKLC